MMYACHCVLLQKRCLMYGHHYVLLKMFWYHVGLSLCTTTKKGTSRVYLKCLANFRSEFSWQNKKKFVLTYVHEQFLRYSPTMC